MPDSSSPSPEQVTTPAPALTTVDIQAQIAQARTEAEAAMAQQFLAVQQQAVMASARLHAMALGMADLDYLDHPIAAIDARAAFKDGRLDDEAVKASVVALKERKPGWFAQAAAQEKPAPQQPHTPVIMPPVSQVIPAAPAPQISQERILGAEVPKESIETHKDGGFTWDMGTWHHEAMKRGKNIPDQALPGYKNWKLNIH